MMLRAMLAVTILACAAPLAAAAGDARLETPPVPGFIQAFEAGNERESIREQVPQGETVEAWTRMITSQRFVGLAKLASIETYLGNVAAGLPRGCPGAKVSPITAAQLSGRAGARLRVDCPRNPATGKPETFLMLAVPIGADIHVKQVAFRRVPSTADIAWAEGLLKGTRVCTAAAPRC